MQGKLLGALENSELAVSAPRFAVGAAVAAFRQHINIVVYYFHMSDVLRNFEKNTYVRCAGMSAARRFS